MWIRRLGEERLKFRGEKHHEITVVPPTGFEPCLVMVTFSPTISHHSPDGASPKCDGTKTRTVEAPKSVVGSHRRPAITNIQDAQLRGRLDLEVMAAAAC